MFLDVLFFFDHFIYFCFQFFCQKYYLQLKRKKSILLAFLLKKNIIRCNQKRAHGLLSYFVICYKMNHGSNERIMRCKLLSPTGLSDGRTKGNQVEMPNPYFPIRSFNKILGVKVSVRSIK
jgi:hypothetical protein